MSCELSKAIEVLRAENNSNINKQLDTILGVTLRSEQLGDRGKGNDKAYHEMLQKRYDKYLELKARIGEEEKVGDLIQTIKDVKFVGTSVIVEFQKGPAKRVVFGSENGKIEYTDENLVQGAMESIEGVQRVLDKLASDGNVDEVYLNYVKKLIGGIDLSLLPKLQLYMKETSRKSQGMLDGKNIVIEYNSDTLAYPSQMSSTEVYAHEMMHAITAFALRNSSNGKAAEIRLKLEKLQDRASKVITAEMLEPENSTFPEKEKEIAKERWKYIFEGKNSLDEFIAYGLTNPKVMQALIDTKVVDDNKSTTLLEAIRNALHKLIGVVIGEYSWRDINKNKHEQLMQLVFDLSRYSTEAANEVERRATVGDKAFRFIDKIANEPLRKLMNNIEEHYESQDIITRPKGKSRLSNIIWTSKMILRLILDKRYRNVREQILYTIGIHPEGWLSNIARDIQDPSELERAIEELGLANGQISRFRDLEVSVVSKEIHNKFTEVLTEFQEEVLTHAIVDTDLSAIREYNIENLLGNNKGIEKEIRNLEKDLDNINWYRVQTDGLASYMSTGLAGIGQYLNAHNIVREVEKPTKEIVDKIDKIATLKALKLLPESVTSEMKELYKTQKEGVEYIIDLQEVSKKEATRLFDTPTNIIKGYSKQLYDDSIDIVIGKKHEEKKMYDKGYKKVKDLKDDLVLYRATTYLTPSYNTHALRLNDYHSKGTTISTLAWAEDEKLGYRIAKRKIDALHIERNKVIADMKAGKKIEDATGITPVLNDAGEVVDYSYQMSKIDKKYLMRNNTKVAEVLAKTIAGVQDKVSTKKQNEAVLELILADHNKNYINGMTIGVNNKVYIRLEKDSTNKTINELYKIIPKSIRDEVDERGGIGIRRDMLHNYFGFRDPSITNNFWVDKLTPEVMKRSIRLAEMVWSQVISISKADIVIRTPAVFIGNFISNMMYSTVMGKSPIEVLKVQYRKYKEIDQYLKNEAELQRLSIEKKRGKDVQGKIDRLQTSQNRSGVRPLMEAGMYQAIVEDLSRQELKSNNKLVRAIDEKTKGVPGWIKDAGHWLYIDETTPLFGAISKATQLSDFVARAAEYEFLLERGKEKDVALKTVLDAFINYTKPASSAEEYMNNMGLFMFTKYMKRVIRAIRTSGREKPANILLSIIGQEMFFDVEDIWDSNPMTRSYSTLMVNPLDNLQHALMPTLVEAI